MRLRTIVHRGSICPAVDHQGRLVALEALAGHDLSAVVGADDGQWAEWVAQGRPVSSDAPLCPPVRPGKIVAIGLNYHDHVRETGLDTPTVPLVFAKCPSSLIAAGEAIAIDTAVTRRVDWEAELAVVIGRRAQRVSVDFCSHSFTLDPGDVLLTGTAWGCGEFMDPPRHLAPGDVVEVEVGGIGVLRNPVVAVASLPEPSVS